MMQHAVHNPARPQRVVILGAKGFVGSALKARLLQESGDVLALGRSDLDLNAPGASDKLAGILLPHDTLVVISAEAPCKNYKMLLNNIQMMQTVCDALTQTPVRHVLYVSSDAVYADSAEKLTESSPAAPTSLHGVMHLARELMLQSILPPTALAIVRPTLLYGVNDPHNGYGPNRFYRLAMTGKTIELFGKGEEERDHVYIADLAELLYLCIAHRSYGVLNAVSGQVISFYNIAEEVIKHSQKPVEILCHPRQGTMPHNGYRAFDTSQCQALFPHFQWRSFSEGLRAMHQLKEKTHA